uniref:UDP-glucose 4-epimerase n=1 Tax=Chromera velia CCMP2878 TaxID=1169474 RepID=A0A0G4HLU3_9ALVE|eukprot:Cvel_28884.t1-p1 / transcript=Cvel_28884.t1 / gene=Cvel_28884 / organism=Chromera_velia_CCMP2878 / gene_product=UDP-glucose 4-epimerase, putative / transcript_product=UDP-glucose 4-epimerase, putative / location=Cvel_scaffold3862:510-2185(+) / protein_length=98 / sequence_SO=supercontig / SO=protein_coding / is_pseudo=false
MQEPESCCLVHNLGIGRGYSVLELVTAFKKASGKKVPYIIVRRRPSDLVSVIADPKKANEELKKRPQRRFTMPVPTHGSGKAKTRTDMKGVQSDPFTN